MVEIDDRFPEVGGAALGVVEQFVVGSEFIGLVGWPRAFGRRDLEACGLNEGRVRCPVGGRRGHALAALHRRLRPHRHLQALQGRRQRRPLLLFLEQRFRRRRLLGIDHHGVVPEAPLAGKFPTEVPPVYFQYASTAMRPAAPVALSVV